MKNNNVNGHFATRRDSAYSAGGAYRRSGPSAAPKKSGRPYSIPQFSSHAQYRSLYTRRQSLEDNADQPDANVTLALADRNLIVGFGVLTYPEAGERWTELDSQVMMEVKAIEPAAPGAPKAWPKASSRCCCTPVRGRQDRVYGRVFLDLGSGWHEENGTTVPPHADQTLRAVRVRGVSDQ